MIYRSLGTTGVTVSALCFGTMSFGDADAADVDAATASAVYSRCRDAGINFFDCANVYGRGKAETTLGRLMHGHRDELVITSKVGFRMRDGLNGEGLSRRSILREVEDSLRRLQTDRIDVYFVHRFDPATPMAEVVAALDTLVQQGKILYPAVSNWAAWQIAKALGIAERRRWARFAVLQPMYNLVKRQAEVELLPLAAEEGLGVIPYSPLGGGLLTGKYGVTTRPERGRLMENQMYQKRYGDEGVYEVAESFTEYALARGIHPATLAVRWVMHHPAVTAPIIGARNVQQLEASLEAADEPLAVEERAAISALSPAPAVATDRSEERA